MKWSVRGSDGERKRERGEEEKRATGAAEQQRQTFFPLQLIPGSHRQQGEWASEWVMGWVREWRSEWVNEWVSECFTFVFYLYFFPFNPSQWPASPQMSDCLWFVWFLMGRLQNLKCAARTYPLLLITQILCLAGGKPQRYVGEKSYFIYLFF